MEKHEISIYVKNFDKISDDAIINGVIYAYFFCTDVITPIVYNNGCVNFFIPNYENETVKQYVKNMMFAVNECRVYNNTKYELIHIHGCDYKIVRID